MGIWTTLKKQAYIESLMRQSPTGILAFVKDHGIAWKVLDGGNRIRAVRDFVNDDQFHTNLGKKFSEFI